jgi:hypothetical protein
MMVRRLARPKATIKDIFNGNSGQLLLRVGPVKNASGATADALAFTVARHELEAALADLGGYVNIVFQRRPDQSQCQRHPFYITAGPVLWVRVRTAGLQGVMGAWSDPAKIMVV